MSFRVLVSVASFGVMAACAAKTVPPDSELMGKDTTGTELPDAARDDAESDGGTIIDNVGDSSAPVEGGSTSFGADPFAGFAAYKGAQPAQTANSRHLQPVTGRDCTQCHGTIAHTFWFGGTAYTTGGAPAAGAEVRAIGPDGKEVGFATADKDGNFWSPVPYDLTKLGQPLPKVVMKVGVRSATKATLMGATFDQRGCNGTACHDAKMKLVVP